MSLEIPSGMDLTKVPLLPNPNGDPPNFENPPSLALATWVVLTILLVVMVPITLLRFRTNFKMYKKFAVDDYLCLFAVVLVVAYSVIVMTSTSTAKHIWDVPISAVDASWTKRSAVLGTIYGPAMFFAKSAILAMYLRIFKIIPWMRWSCYISIVFLFCSYWSLVPVSVIYNFPHGDEKWDLAMTASSAPAQVPFLILGIISVISDLFIFVLPLPPLIKLHVSWKKKLGLCLVFATAIIGIVSSCLVLYFRIVLWQNKTLDSTWNVAASYITVAVELNIAVIVSCAPGVAASWKHVLIDSFIFTGLRSAFNSSKQSLLRVIPSSNRSRRSRSDSESGRNIASSGAEALEKKISGRVSSSKDSERTIAV